MAFDCTEISIFSFFFLSLCVSVKASTSVLFFLLFGFGDPGVVRHHGRCSFCFSYSSLLGSIITVSFGRYVLLLLLLLQLPTDISCS